MICEHGLCIVLNFNPVVHLTMSTTTPPIGSSTGEVSLSSQQQQQPVAASAPSRPKKSKTPTVLESLGIVVAKGSKKRVKLAASESRRVRVSFEKSLFVG